MKHLRLNNPIYERYVKDMNKELKTRGFNRGKDSMYPRCMREFLFFLERKGVNDIKEVKPKHIEAYYVYISTRPNQRRDGKLSTSMIRHHLYSLNLLFDYFLHTGVRDSNPVRVQKFNIPREGERIPITLEEITELFNVTESLRDKALLALAYGCGLRRSELEKLRVQDVVISQASLLVRDGKYGKSRTVPLSEGVIIHLRNYLHYERENYYRACSQHTDAFLISEHKHAMRGDEMNTRLKALVKRTHNASLEGKNVTLHTLRHSIATHLTDKGADMEFVQNFLGHAEIDTAMIYAKRRKQTFKLQGHFNNNTSGFNPPKYDDI